MNLNQYSKECKRTVAPTDLAFKRVEGGTFGSNFILSLVHAYTGLFTESAEFADALKKHLFYGKMLDLTNMSEELGDIMWYWGLACSTLGLDPEVVLDQNVAKLQSRYPEKFTAEKALNRDIPKELMAFKVTVPNIPPMEPPVVPCIPNLPTTVQAAERVARVTAKVGFDLHLQPTDTQSNLMEELQILLKSWAKDHHLTTAADIRAHGYDSAGQLDLSDLVVKLFSILKVLNGQNISK